MLQYHTKPLITFNICWLTHFLLRQGYVKFIANKRFLRFGVYITIINKNRTKFEALKAHTYISGCLVPIVHTREHYYYRTVKHY